MAAKTELLEKSTLLLTPLTFEEEPSPVERGCHSPTKPPVSTTSLGELSFNSPPLSPSNLTVTVTTASTNYTDNFVELIPSTSTLSATTTSDWAIDPNNAGRLLYRGTVSRRCLLRATLSFQLDPSNSAGPFFGLYRNANTILLASRVYFGNPGGGPSVFSTNSPISLQTSVNVQPGDFFSLITGDGLLVSPATLVFFGINLIAVGF